MKCWALIPLTYFAGAMLTFASIYEAAEIGTDRYRGPDEMERNFGSFLGGMFWPVYWSGKGALYVVRAAKTSAKACVDANGISWEPSGGICRYPRPS